MMNRLVQSKSPRKIAVFTGTRAEYGIMRMIIEKLHAADNVTLQLFVGGTHLCAEHGYTVQEIVDDGIPISEKLDYLLNSDSPVSVSKSMGLALFAMADCLHKHQPDLCLILGDRFEALAMAQACMLARVPIAHIHGGESTEGLIDEAIRHAITKMAHLHFTSTEQYRQRVIQLGEAPERVFNVGAPGIDSIKNLALLPLQTLNEQLEFDLGEKFFLVTFHPVTLQDMSESKALENLFEALCRFSEYKVVLTYPNADTQGTLIVEQIKGFGQSHPDRVLLVQSLGQLRYLSLMKLAAAVIGNSSSGLIEAPSLHVPTVDIGDRQKGRVAPDSVIQCDETQNGIEQAISRAISEDFARQCQHLVNPYGQGHASQSIVEKVTTASLEGILFKSFHDIVD